MDAWQRDDGVAVAAADGDAVELAPFAKSPFVDGAPGEWRLEAACVSIDAGGDLRLSHEIGAGMTKLLAFTGRRIDAGTALRVGIVQEVVPKDELLSHVRGLAEEICGNAPLAVQGTSSPATRAISTATSPRAIPNDARAGASR